MYEYKAIFVDLFPNGGKVKFSQGFDRLSSVYEYANYCQVFAERYVSPSHLVVFKVTKEDGEVVSKSGFWKDDYDEIEETDFFIHE